VDQERNHANLDAERALLGALLFSQTTLGEIAEEVSGEDFYAPRHQTVYETIRQMAATGQPIDLVTVSDELEKRGELASAGGGAYLADLASAAAPSASATYYAEIISQQAKLRRLADAGTRLIQLAATRDGRDANQMIDAAQAEVHALTASRDRRGAIQVGDGAAAWAETAQTGRPAKALPTGFADLDHLTGGLRGGQMVIVAARPAVGKSTLALDFTRCAALRQRQPVMVFSLEMSATEVIKRVLAAEARVPLDRLRDDTCDDSDWPRIARVTNTLKNTSMWLDDTPGLSVMELRSKARRIAETEGGLSLVVVDYLQLMRGHGRPENRQQEVSELSRSLKLLAKELDTPIIAVSQLNRAAEARQDKRPQMSDLRESGSLEQDADMVILLHRPPAGDPASGAEAELILAKHRNGPTGTIRLVFQGHYARFASLAPDL
jgi:replicative DNA helicase